MTYYIARFCHTDTISRQCGTDYIATIINELGDTSTNPRVDTYAFRTREDAEEAARMAAVNDPDLDMADLEIIEIEAEDME